MFQPEVYRPSSIGPHDVTKFFTSRNRLWSVASPEELCIVAEELGLSIDPESLSGNTRQNQQKIFRLYLDEEFPRLIKDEDTHLRLEEIVKNIQQYFVAVNSNMVCTIFGSYAKGKTNPYSDLDFLLFAGEGNIDPEVELRNLQGLREMGCVFSEDLSSFRHALEVIKTGKGLARLYGLTQDHIEIESHILGIKDAFSLPSINAHRVERVIPVEPKFETRSSLKGRTNAIRKPGDFVPSFFDDGGELYVGFFPAVILISDIVHDYQNRGEQISQIIWRALVKAFAYHNDAYVRTSSGKLGISLNGMYFEDFLKIASSGESTSYSDKKLLSLKQKFEDTIYSLAARYKMPVIIR